MFGLEDFHSISEKESTPPEASLKTTSNIIPLNLKQPIQEPQGEGLVGLNSLSVINQQTRNEEGKRVFSSSQRLNDQHETWQLMQNLETLNTDPNEQPKLRHLQNSAHHPIIGKRGVQSEII